MSISNQIGLSKSEFDIDPEYEKLVPKLSLEEYESLKQSIKKNGLHIPIVVSNGRKILDGHNRYKICRELNICVKFMNASFENKLLEKKFVIEANLKRRQLNDYQKSELGMALLEVEKELRGQGKRTDLASIDAKLEKGKATEIVSKQIGVSTSTFERAKKVIEKAPEATKESLRKGELSISKAYNDIKTPDKIAEENLSPDMKALNEASKEFQDWAMELFIWMWVELKETLPKNRKRWKSNNGRLVEPLEEILVPVSDKERIESLTNSFSDALGGCDITPWLKNCVRNLYYADKKENELSAKVHPELYEPVKEPKIVPKIT